MPKDVVANKIYNLLSHNPGLVVAKIALLLDMKISEVEHHLHILEQQNRIIVVEEAGYPYYYIKDEKINIRDKQTREISHEIYTLIEQNPGLHLSKIAELAGMSVSLANYYLFQLEKNQEIFSLKAGKRYYKRYYIPTSNIEEREKKILEELKKKTSLQIILFLLKKTSAQHYEMLEYFNMAPSTLSYHLAKLVAGDILKVQTYGLRKGYSLKNREEIIRMLKKYEFHIELNLTNENVKEK